MPAAEKRAAQNAAVVGRIFWDALIGHLSRQGTSATGEVLRRLRVKELVVPRQPSALAGAAEFGFRHVLIRDVAYDSLPKRDRAAKHLDVARWAEETLVDRQDEMVELLAAHYSAALEYEEEFAAPDSERLRDLRQKTYTYARRAGNRADTLSNKEHAARWFRAAVEHARDLGVPARERVALALEYNEAASGYEPPQALLAVLDEALTLGQALPDLTASDEQQLAQVQINLSALHYMNDDVDRARAVARDGIARLEPGPPTAGRAGLRARLGWTYWRGGPLEDAPPILREAIEEARACRADDVTRIALHDLGIATCFLGDVRTGVAMAEESMELARAANDRALMTRCYINVPTLMSGNGEMNDRIMPIYKEGLDQARRSMDHATASWIAQNIGALAVFQGRLDDAALYVEEALAAARTLGEVGRIAGSVGERGFFRLTIGDRAGARADFPRRGTWSG